MLHVENIPMWIVQSGFQANSGAGNTPHLDLFNAAGSGVILKVRSSFIIQSQGAVAGIGNIWSINRSNTVGTGGTALTPRPADTANAALPAQVTARGLPTGGAATLYGISTPFVSTEETNPFSPSSAVIDFLSFLHPSRFQPIYCREGEGVCLRQVNASAIGSTNSVIVFSVE